MTNPKILIADDGLVIRTLVTRKLEENGYVATAVSGGDEVLQKLGAEPFDLIVLDIYMLEINGIETLLQIRKKFTRIQLPVIMVTCKDEDEDIVACFKEGANDFVSKPINFPILLARIENQLKLKQAVERLTHHG